MDDWKEFPECFGKGKDDLIACGKCEDKIDCIQAVVQKTFFNQLKKTEDVENEEKLRKEMGATMAQFVPLSQEEYMSQTLKRWTDLVESKTLFNMRHKLIKQGFEANEATLILLEIVKKL